MYIFGGHIRDIGNLRALKWGGGGMVKLWARKNARSYRNEIKNKFFKQKGVLNRSDDYNLNQIFSNHSMAFSPFSPTFPSENANFRPFVILEMIWFPAQTWCQKQRRPKLERNSQFPTISAISSILPLSTSALMFLNKTITDGGSTAPQNCCYQS